MNLRYKGFHVLIVLQSHSLLHCVNRKSESHAWKIRKVHDGGLHQNPASIPFKWNEICGMYTLYINGCFLASVHRIVKPLATNVPLKKKREGKNIMVGLLSRTTILADVISLIGHQQSECFAKTMFTLSGSTGWAFSTELKWAFSKKLKFSPQALLVMLVTNMITIHHVYSLGSNRLSVLHKIEIFSTSTAGDW